MRSMIALASIVCVASAPSGLAQRPGFSVMEATIDDIRAALKSGEATCRSIVRDYLARIDAYDNVVVVTPTDTVRATRGSYWVETGIAQLKGSVKITRCDGTQLNGNEAQVDMNSGKATLTSGPGGPVRGIIVPGEKGKTADGCPTAKR